MVANMWSKHLATLAAGLDLDGQDAQWCMAELLEGRDEIEGFKEFLIAL